MGKKISDVFYFFADTYGKCAEKPKAQVGDISSLRLKVYNHYLFAF